MEKEFETKKTLEEMRHDIKTFDELVSYLQYVKDNCNTCYGEAPRAISQAALAVSWYLASEFGITGWQAGFVMWDYVRGWRFNDNKCGLRLIDYDEMLYPQHEYKFEKIIPLNIFEDLKIAAKEKIEEERPYAVHPDVLAHWKSIAEGNIPFGYKIGEV